MIGELLAFPLPAVRAQDTQKEDEKAKPAPIPVVGGLPNVHTPTKTTSGTVDARCQFTVSLPPSPHEAVLPRSSINPSPSPPLWRRIPLAARALNPCAGAETCVCWATWVVANQPRPSTTQGLEGKTGQPNVLHVTRRWLGQELVWRLSFHAR